MFISVKTLANCINNKKRIDIDNWKIAEVNVVLSDNGHRLEYFINYANGTGERYTEQNVPDSIIRLINKYPVTHKAETKTDKTFYYRFV